MFEKKEVPQQPRKRMMQYMNLHPGKGLNTQENGIHEPTKKTNVNLNMATGISCYLKREEEVKKTILMTS